MFTSPSLGLLGLILAEHLLGPQLMAEGRTTCAREAAATRCWGESEFLYGAGVTGVPGIRKWALQSYHRCVLSERYGLRCDGSGDPTVLRIDDPGASPVEDFALSSRGGCMLSADGLVNCWPWDGGDRVVPTWSSLFVPDAQQIVVTDNFPCVLTREGAVVCWAPQCSAAPRVVLQDVVALAGAREDLCATRRDGSVACWHAPDFCEDMGIESRVAGVESRVEGVEEAASVAMGLGYACVLQSRGGVTCWTMDAKGRPGEPRSIPGTAQVTSVAVGDHHACGRDVDGQIWCWGDNSAGQLGQYDVIDDLEEPTVVPGIDDAVALAGNIGSTCALLAGGSVECWGRDYGSPEWSATPSVRAELSPARHLFPFGFNTMCVELRGGELRCRGKQRASDIRNPNAETTEILGTELYPLVCIHSTNRIPSCTFGVAQDSSHPTSVRLPPTDILALDPHAGVLRGVTRRGVEQIRLHRRSVPERELLATSSLVTGLSASYHQVCTVDIRGRVACADYLEGGTLTVLSSMDVVDVVELDAGTEHTCALDSHGRVYCWGDNTRFQLGLATEERRIAVPLRVPGVENVVQVLAVGERTCALVASGAVYCWGSNVFGASGAGNPASSLDPLPIHPPLPPIHGTENSTRFLPRLPLK